MDVSEYILRKQLTGNLKLQKLLYFVQAYFLIKKGIPCFSDKIYAWDSGPTIPAVYRYFSRSTLFFAFPDDIYIVENEDGRLERRCYDIENIPKDDRKLIDEVIEAFSGYTPSWMLDLIRGQDPYIKACKDEGEIKLMDLKEFFE